MSAIEPEDGDWTVECGSHGKVPWKFDIICDGCGKVHNMDDPAPPVCQCGKQLLPTEPPREFSARMVCPACAKSLRAGVQ